MSSTQQQEGIQTIPQLPALEPTLQLLDVPRALSHMVHALTVDQTLLAGGDATWIDSGRHAQSGPLVDIAPSERILDRVHVARGFTAFQHFELVRTLPGRITDRTALVVVPAIDRLYRGDDLLGDEGQRLLLTALATLRRITREYEIPVLLTRQRADEFSEPVATAAARTIRCERTPFGPRFNTGDEEETLVYPTDYAGYVQTTLTFWARILRDRQPLYEAPSEVAVCGTN